MASANLSDMKYCRNYYYYQPNDHKCGDCSIRAVAGALDVKWEEALRILCDEAFKTRETPCAVDNIISALKPYGFKWVAIKPKKGEKRPTVTDFARDHADGSRYILRVSGHVVCAHDGNYYDIWDCGKKCLYGYLEKSV